jgi:hypothetical protein
MESYYFSQRHSLNGLTEHAETQGLKLCSFPSSLLMLKSWTTIESALGKDLNFKREAKPLLCYSKKFLETDTSYLLPTM